MQLLKIESIGLIVAGVILFYVLRRRRFNRRTITGSEQFRSYEHAWLTRLLEGFFRLLALCMILAGVAMLYFLSHPPHKP